MTSFPSTFRISLLVRFTHDPAQFHGVSHVSQILIEWSLAPAVWWSVHMPDFCDSPLWEPTFFMCTYRFIWELEESLEAPHPNATKALFLSSGQTLRQEKRTLHWSLPIWKLPTRAFSLYVCVSWHLCSIRLFFIKLFQPLAFATPFSPPCTTSYLWIALLPVISSIHIHTTRKALLFSILIISELVFEIQPLLSNPLYNFQKQSFKHANSQCPILPPAGQIPDLWLEARNCPRSGPTSLRLSESRVLPCTQGQTWDRHSLFLYQSMLFPFLYLRLCVALSPNSLFCLD